MAFWTNPSSFKRLGEFWGLEFWSLQCTTLNTNGVADRTENFRLKQKKERERETECDRVDETKFGKSVSWMDVFQCLSYVL
jgi:hypothetical protein